MLLAMLAALAGAAPATTVGTPFSISACERLRSTAPVLAVQCPPSPELAVLVDPYGTDIQAFAIVSVNKETHRATLVVVSRRYDLPDSAYTRGWHVDLLGDWAPSQAPVRLEVLPRGRFERVPPFNRARDAREVDELDTRAEAILIHQADRRRWLFAPIGDEWKKVYLGIPHAD